MHDYKLKIPVNVFNLEDDHLEAVPNELKADEHRGMAPKKVQRTSIAGSVVGTIVDLVNKVQSNVQDHFILDEEDMGRTFVKNVVKTSEQVNLDDPPS